ncbi:MAG: HepT-like ribonuclease domain-containing protein [Microcoleaceae cyanobacterium]
MSRDRETLIDIVEAIKLILRYVEAVNFANLAANIEKQDAILRRITIIGEATKRLSKDFREQHPTIPWKEIAGMRDVITHDYDEVDLDEVWTVINENLPQLLNYIEPLVSPRGDDS